MKTVSYLLRAFLACLIPSVFYLYTVRFFPGASGVPSEGWSLVGGWMLAGSLFLPFSILLGIAAFLAGTDRLIAWITR